MNKGPRRLKFKASAKNAFRRFWGHHSPVRLQRPEKGMLSIVELMIGTLIIALLLLVAVSTLRITERGTVSQKKREQALNLAKARTEELKSYLSSQKWNNMKVDVRFPPTQTPAVGSYNAYEAATVTLGKQRFIVKPEVRYVFSDATNRLHYMPTPGDAVTDEIGNLLRIRVDAYYGDPATWRAIPTVEAGNLPLSDRVVYTNLLANRTINVGALGQIWGYVFEGCSPTLPVDNVEIGLYQGAVQMYRALTDSTGYYFFNEVAAGAYNIQITSSPGYSSQGPCNFTNPVTLTAGNNLTNQQMGVTLIPNWNYFGVVVKSTPVITPVIPPAHTPTPNMTATPVIFTVPGAVVFADDGNSSPTTASASGAYTILNVRSTPVAGHTYDTIEADDLPTTQMGQNYNWGHWMYPHFHMGAATYIGPITIYVNSSMTNTLPVTFIVLDEESHTLSGNYPMTLLVADGSVSPPVATINLPNFAVTMNVHPGNPFVTVRLNNNTSPPSWLTFNQSLALDATTAQPVTLMNYAVGGMAGTVCGMGASFNYSQFNIMAQDDQNQFTYKIPVSYDGSATFGTFNYQFLRTPLQAPYGGDLFYSFMAVGSGEYTSTVERKDARRGQARVLDDPIRVSPLNVYAAVTVKTGGQPYAHGSWVSAQMVPPGSTPVPSPPTAGMGNGFTVSYYFSTVTKGDGTGLVQVQLAGGQATTYIFSAQIVNPDSFAASTMSQTFTVDKTNTFTSPKGVSFSF
jgi:hypothetical protein